MALTSTVVANSNTTIISGTANKVRAVTCIFFCNTHATNIDTITVYAWYWDRCDITYIDSIKVVVD